MADAKATFAIGLDTEGLVEPGDEAADVLAKLRDQIVGQTADLARLNAAMKNIKGGASTNVAAYRELKERIDKTKQSIASAQSDFVNMGGKLSDLAKKTKPAASAVDMLSNAAGATGGPLGRALQGASGLAGKLGSLRLALFGIAAAMVAVTVAIGALTVKLISFALASANAARSELLHLKGLTTIRNFFGIAAGSATELQNAITRVSASSALGREKIAGFAEQLYKSGLRGQNLADALDATAIKASVQGDEYANLFMSVAAGANMAGASVKGLADQVRNRLGGIAKEQALDLNVQIEKLHESFSALFAGVAIDPVLRQLQEIGKIFSQATVTGQALKKLVEHLFSPLAGTVGGLGVLVKRFFQGMILGALDVEIAILRLRVWFKKTFGDRDQFKGIEWANTALLLGRITIYSIVAGLGLLAAAIAGVVAIVKPFVDLFESLFDLVTNFDWGGLGKSIVDGLDKALAAGKDVLNLRVSDLVDSVKKKFVSLFEIGSPSRWSARQMGFVVEGATNRLEKGQGEIRASLGGMLNAPNELAATSSTPTGAAAPAGATVSIGELHYHAGAAGRDSHAADAADFRAQLQRELEGMRIQMGAAV